MNKAIAATIFIGMTWLPSVQAAPRADCAAAGATMPCLDARLKEANQRLNATLKAAQERLEQLQARGGRPVMGAFVDSQRKFNAYRDAQCSWQGVRAQPGENTAEYVRECQLLETLARDEALAAFAQGEGDGGAASVQPSSEDVTEAPRAQAAAPDTPAAPVAGAGSAQSAGAGVPQPSAGSRGLEWRLSTWMVGGQEKTILQESAISIAFDPSGKVAGIASVNRFSGTYRFDADGRLLWPPSFTTTRMAGTPALMAQERAFLGSLRRTSRYRVDGTRLILESADASVMLGFSR